MAGMIKDDVNAIENSLGTDQPLNEHMKVMTKIRKMILAIFPTKKRHMTVDRWAVT